MAELNIGISRKVLGSSSSGLLKGLSVIQDGNKSYLVFSQFFNDFYL